MAENDDNDLLDYEEEETETAAEAQAAKDLAKKDVKGTYVSIHSSGFRDFLLKPELLRAIVDCGFEHPSEGILSTLVDSISVLSLFNEHLFSFSCLHGVNKCPVDVNSLSHREERDLLKLKSSWVINYSKGKYLKMR